MKKCLVAIVFVASMVAGCQKTEIYREAQTKMQFAGEIQKQTKASGEAPSAATETPIANLQAQDFRVWAFQNWDDPLTTETNEINSVYDKISNLLITYKPAAGNVNAKWDTGKDYYWPGTGKSLKFYAISSSNWTPKEVDATKVENVSITHTDGSTALGTMTITDFTVGPKADNDLMVADACIQMQDGSTAVDGVIVGNTVSQTFRHALTKVRFSFITTTTTTPVFVQSVTTTAMVNKGDLTVTFGNKIGFAWTTEGNVPFSDDCDTEIAFSAKEVTKVWLKDADEATPVEELTDNDGITLNDQKYTPIDTWLMIPQSLANQTVTITYILKDRQFSRTFPLAVSNDLTAWAPNQFVDYKVTIAPNMIDFDATVEGWTEKEVFIDDATDSE